MIVIEPGVLSCGCLWDGEMLCVLESCEAKDHDTPPGTVYFRCGRTSPMLDEWPDPGEKWIWGQ